MHTSKDLEIVITVLLQQLEEVGILLDTASIVIPSKDQKTSVDWTASKKYKYSKGFIVPFMENGKPVLSGEINRDIVAALKSGKEFTKSYSRKEKNKYYQNLFDKSGFSETPEARKEFLLNLPGISVSTAGSKNSYIQIFSYSGEELSAVDLAVLKRFAMVFEQCYIRFQDLEKAEEQAREAQIEAALERVRSRSMGMHKSNELKDVVRLLYKEFRILVTDIDSVNIQLNLDSSKDIHFWASVEEDIYPELYHLPYSDLPIFEKFYNAFSSPGEGFFDYLLKKEEKDDFFNEVFKIQPVPPLRKKMIQNAEGMVMMGWFHRHSGVDIVRYNLQRFSEEEKDIVKRFAAAFEQTYIRFTDLQKAEAQAREAEIEAALERVRSRTMAMQKSDELAETASHLFRQLNVLGIRPYRFNIAIVDSKSDNCQLWSTTNEGKVIPTGPLIPLKEYSVFNQMYDGWKQQQSVNVIKVEGEERITWTKYIMKYVSFDEYRPENIDLERLRHEPAIFSNFFFKQGFVVVHTLEEINGSDIKIIQRFINVFEQTYTRFLDLEKAETQAREAEIQLALERVRSRSMAMRHSSELQEVVNLVSQQLNNMKLDITGVFLGIKNDEIDKQFTFWGSTGVAETYMKRAAIPFLDRPIYTVLAEATTKDERFFEEEYTKEEKIEFFEHLFKHPPYNSSTLEWRNQVLSREGGYTRSVVVSHFTFIFVVNHFGIKLSDEDNQILKRFGQVFEQSYTRFLDLQNAEAQAKEVVKQASLDRVRGEIASMRTAEDLNRITPIIWRELKTLEVPFIRCGVFIVNEENENVQVYLTTPDGKSLGVLNLTFNANELTNSTVANWKRKQVYKEHWSREEFINWTKSMMELGQVQNAETYQGSSNPPDSLHLHFVPFTQGMLYVGDVSPLTDEKLDLVKTLAEAFSIAYARYEDFKNLEDAKNKIEITLTDLKSAQVQLVHSEKMASLGELTAGIAHEIKNPLNFVNNFSEISGELISEVEEELEKNDKEEVLSILKDLKQNLVKINQHGKRADSIVKGMLLHSRGTSGEKTLTDINDLLEQYVNLAYHGMRAQNKEFNITIEKDYDKTLEKITVVPQDISRVFLNIINNACYAAYDRKKKSSDDYFSPILKVSTKKLDGKVEIKIGDNGNGIPKDILDKIFQPFFTTKPTGEGTGLGLSLSYDIIVKRHGGEMKVETKEGEGTAFIIKLTV